MSESGELYSSGGKFLAKAQSARVETSHTIRRLAFFAPLRVTYFSDF